ncbi:hypothetical protein AYO44_14100 [Planctomycetaceae bacterium SCGC AG-212-F19]|nr:hypothetical protein AYO44_14100 [Planctomycetaceae bacterium SCGC AG-212-F19]
MGKDVPASSLFRPWWATCLQDAHQGFSLLAMEEDMIRYGLVALLALVAGVLVAADDPAAEAKKFEGAWTMVSGEKDGKGLPEPSVKTAKLVIKGDQHDVRIGDDTFKGTHKLDPTKKPKTIDATDTEGPFKGKTVLGIYELDGDSFKVCFAEPGKDRPKEFSTKSGTGHILHVWKKEKK